MEKLFSEVLNFAIVPTKVHVFRHDSSVEAVVIPSIDGPEMEEFR